MEIDVRPFSGEPRDFFAAGELAFGGRLRDDDLEAWSAIFEPDRAIAAYDGDRIVGTAGEYSFELTIPGGVLPAAGVTLVGVQPTHRRRGILRRMMRLELDRIHERGEPLAVLWASEGSIYGRFGYGLATLALSIDVPRERTTFRAAHVPAGAVRFVDVEEARRLFPPVYDALRLERAGFFARSPAYWEHDALRDAEHWRRGASEAFLVVHEVAGEVDGYARYRIRESWEPTGPKSSVIVGELMASSPAARADLWRYLMDIDLTARLEAWNLPSDDPLLLSVLEPRRLQATFGDGMWVRLVDIPSALAGRRYATDGTLRLELEDELCGWNDGVWELAVQSGVPIVGRAEGAADLALDVTDLGSAYLGGFSFRRLADAGRVRELTPGAISRADGMFRTERAPWCPRVF